MHKLQNRQVRDELSDGEQDQKSRQPTVNSPKELALAVIEAARKRMASFNHGAAAAVSEFADVRLDDFYTLSIREAAEADGTNAFLSYPVYLLLQNSWDAALDWAEKNKDR